MSREPYTRPLSYWPINGRASIGVNPKTTTSFPLRILLSSFFLFRSCFSPLVRTLKWKRACERSGEQTRVPSHRERKVSFIARILLKMFSDCCTWYVSTIPDNRVEQCDVTVACEFYYDVRRLRAIRLQDSSILQRETMMPEGHQYMKVNVYFSSSL